MPKFLTAAKMKTLWSLKANMFQPYLLTKLFNTALGASIKTIMGTTTIMTLEKVSRTVDNEKQ